MYGAAFFTPRGLIPFGNSCCFLYKNQLNAAKKGKGEVRLNYDFLLAKNPSLGASRIDYVFEYYPDLWKDWFEKSNVQRELENV